MEYTFYFLAGNPPAWWFAAALIGLLAGSFLNVVIYRLPVMLEREWLDSAKEILSIQPEPEPREPFNLVIPNSCCPHCHAPIKAWQNIPVISFLCLKGRCQYCKAPISLRYPIIEIVSALLAFIVALQLDFSLQALCALGLSWSLLALSMIDYDHHLLPDHITLPLLWAGLLINTQEVFVPLEQAVWGAAMGYLSLWLVYQTFKILTGKEGMGYGDFKLLAALGAWLGWQALPTIIFCSSFVGAVIGVSLILFSGRSRHQPIPFGPYLAAAGWLTLLWGDVINVQRWLG